MLIMFGNIKSTDKTTFYMIKFWMNVHMKEKITVGRFLAGKAFWEAGTEPRSES